MRLSRLVLSSMIFVYQVSAAWFLSCCSNRLSWVFTNRSKPIL